MFEDADACVTPVLNIEDIPSSYLHQQRQSFTPTADDPTELLPNPAPRLSHSPAQPSHREGKRPAMGQHSREVLQELGYSREELEAFLREGVVEGELEAHLLKAKM